MIQVASGILRGVPLRSPAGKQTRPSSERLRQGTFNVLRHYGWSDSSIVPESLTVDLFGGTGAWGIEAMSNGAAEVWFVESHPLALRALQENLNIAVRSFELQNITIPRIHVLRKDVALVYKKLPVTRLMFCDPPYEQGWPKKIMELERRYNRIEPGGLLLYEAAAKEEMPTDTAPLKHFDSKIYGDSAVHFFVKEG